MPDLQAVFEIEQENGIDCEFQLEDQSQINAEFSIEVPITQHNSLSGRDADNCHPIKAITGLSDELDEKVDKVSTANRVYGTDSNGNQTTYDANSFGQVDDVQVDGISVVQNKIASLGTMAGLNYSVLIRRL